MKVKTFDMERINILIKESNEDLQNYIKCLKKSSEGWEILAKKALNKLKQNYIDGDEK